MAGLKTCENTKSYSVEIGSVLCNRYRVEQKLGNGSSASVWRCWDLQNKLNVALKIADNKNFETEVAQHEINILQSISNNNSNRPNKFTEIIDQFRIHTSENCTQICIILQLMDGSLTSLFYIPNGSDIIYKYSRNIIKQILLGLDYLHTECEIIHCDIKPDNILYNLDKKLNIKIADLGSARPLYKYKPCRKGGQTYIYRSLELLLEAPFGSSSDIWSTACTAFALVTGNHLFESQVGETYSRNEDHLAAIICLLGDIPKHIALSGKYSCRYFTEEGKFRHVSQRKPKGLVELLVDDFEWDFESAMEFADFLLPMLEFDPDKRASARQCLSHPWLKFC